MLPQAHDVHLRCAILRIRGCRDAGNGEFSLISLKLDQTEI